jgi:hypothetical protein
MEWWGWLILLCVLAIIIGGLLAIKMVVKTQKSMVDKFTDGFDEQVAGSGLLRGLAPASRSANCPR